jgi:hypothetical protein
MLTYPKMFTDPEWKKLEKLLKVSNTGIGATLRELENAHKNLDAGIQALIKKAATVDKVEAARKTTHVAALKSVTAVDKTLGKLKPGDAKKSLTDYRFKINRYTDELRQFDINDHRGIGTPVDRFNHRVTF